MYGEKNILDPSWLSRQKKVTTEIGHKPRIWTFLKKSRQNDKNPEVVTVKVMKNILIRMLEKTLF